ncbi:MULTISPECIES: ferritin-like domain-containing protein [unclassified Sphingomonas]|jgi:Ferritin-like domain|uniref:ferritin-like domain-containing protein n=1 Tax=unclassified Sphingomonas TaxID=196159 RepID=UPI000E105755|nr:MULTISPECIES: ferritin-like domain-containing protein [unclassified Sphingomonas]AXJ95143.1 ferritin-like domain-containing protein [Sphingomonas sp. FARSPH]
MTDFSSHQVVDAIAARRAERRAFLRYAGGAAAASGGLALLSACGGSNTGNTPTPTPSASATDLTGDFTVLNFALNLEYLEAQFYSYAAYGTGLSAGLTGGIGTPGAVTGGAKATLSDTVAKYAREIAADEAAHVGFLRATIGASAVAMPAINIGGDATGAFTAAAVAAGLIAQGQTFNPYASDVNFLLAAFLLEDVGVTAYKGAAPLLQTKVYIEAAAGILATEAYHAGLVRTLLYRQGVSTNAIFGQVQQISDARDSLDGTTDLDQGIGNATTANIVPTDTDGVTFSRSTGQVLNIAYLNKAQVKSGGFFPSGVNGAIFSSAASG